MKKLCGICGGGRLKSATFTACDDRDMTRMVGLPRTECTSCGSLEPDDVEIARMSEADVPGCVRTRCAARTPTYNRRPCYFSADKTMD
jgi:hypothetical protein